MAKKLTKAEVSDLLISDFDERMGAGTRTADPQDGLLGSLLVACGDISEASQEVGPGGRLFVAASLPNVISASTSCTDQIWKALVKTLKFVTGEEVYTSDVKDWSFVEDALDVVYARIDESLSAEAGVNPRKKLRKSHDEDSFELNTVLDSGNGRPQDGWLDLIDNYRPVFVPILKEKHNSLRPMDPLIVKLQSADDKSSIKAATVDFGNVYEYEITQCMKTIRTTVNDSTTLRDIVEFENLESTDFEIVDTEEKLDDLINEIQSTKEVAIDLEHHDIHTYRGFTCLIQISTRRKDYIIDPFPLFHVLGKLNQVTSDPTIVKVLHGADMDIQWLQRDFGVYIVNMFDTGQAARVLGLAGGFGLANLLDTFCKVHTNKKYQTSDWRQRPIPREMLQYARIDTHYLLYIYDKLWNYLLSLGCGTGTAPAVTAYGKKMLIQTLEKSFGIASKVYKDMTCDYDGESVQMCLKGPAMRVGSIRKNPKAMSTLRAVLKWRDLTAKRLDESRHFVLSNSSCLRLANSVPATTAQLLRALSYEKGNSFMPAMRISTDLGDDIMALIDEQIKDDTETQLADSKNIVVMESASPEETNNRLSVVSAGRESFGKIQRRSSSVPPAVSIVTGATSKVASSLFEMFSASYPIESESRRDAVITAIEKFLSQVPESIKDDLDAFIAGGKNAATVVDEQVDTSRMELDTEFVSFTSGGKSAPSKRKQIDWENGEVPQTIREERRDDIGGKNQKKARLISDAAASGQNAAMKALEFIEKELSLGRK